MNKEWLYNEYVIKDRSTQNIADEYGCKRNTIQCWLARFGIKKKIDHHEVKRTKQYQNREYLYDQIIIQHKSCMDVARLNHVSGDTIYKYCNEYNIPYNKKIYKTEFDQDAIDDICNLYIHGTSINQISIKYNVTRKAVRRVLAEHNVEIRNLSTSQLVLYSDDIDPRIYDAEWLKTQYWDNNKSCKEIGQELNINQSTVRRRMHNLNVRVRTNSEAKIGVLAGDKHPNWKGGVTPLDMLLREYFHTNLAPLAAKRDNYTCQICGKTHTILNVHHIIHFSTIVNEIISEHPDLNPNNPDDKMILYDIIVHDNRFLDLNNLITLCKDCHIKIHSKKIISNQAAC